MTAKLLDPIEEDWSKLLEKILYRKDSKEVLNLTAKERELLILKLRTAVDVAPIVQAISDVLKKTIIDWKTVLDSESEEKP